MGLNIVASVSPVLTEVSLTAIALRNIPQVQPGDDLVKIIQNGLLASDLKLQQGDVLVVTSKIISKAEGRLVVLASIEPGAEAQRIAAETEKDPRLVELILRESRSISRQAGSVLVTEHRLGFVSANAGIDQSNVDHEIEQVLLLPEDPDATARFIHKQLHAVTGVKVGVIISDSHGRPFRLGSVGVAIGVAGMPALLDLRGQTDMYGRELRISMQGYADMVASTAQLLSGEGAEGRPIVLLRGLNFPDQEGSARDLQRSPEQDLYR